MSPKDFSIGTYVYVDNPENIMVVIGRKFDENFLQVRCCFTNKGKCSHEKVIHYSKIKNILSLRKEDFNGCNNLKDVKEKHPEEFL